MYEVNHKGFDDDFKSKQLDIHQAQREVNVPLNDVYHSNLNSLNKPFSLQEVEFAVSKSKNKKAVGIDKVSNELLKCDCIIVLLLEFFNSCLRSKRVLTAWCTSILCPQYLRRVVLALIH